jgi:hypothetical protein
MEGNPPGGGHGPPGIPSVGQTSNALVPVTPVSSTNIKLPTVQQLHYQWSNQKIRSLILRTPKRSSTMVDVLTTSEVQNELLNYTPPSEEEPAV